MPDEKNFMLHYSDYFAKNSLGSSAGILVIFLIGIFAGLIAISILNYQSLEQRYAYALVNGMSVGLLIISLPALISSALIKILKRRIYLKHILMIAIFSTLAYSFFVILNSLIYLFFKSEILAYIVILLANASLFGLWFVISRFVMGRRRDTLIGVIQPTLNFLFYIPLGKYLINISLPLWPALVKLYAGMLVFMAIGYIFLEMVDRPVKKTLNISGVEIFTVMVSQWLYNIGTLDFSLGIGEKKDINVKALAIKGKNGIKSIFVEPDIHYGPFAGTGGAAATEYLGNLIAKKYSATPFVLHGAVNAKLNPISTSEISIIGRELQKNIEGLSFSNANGSIGFGEKRPCKAIAIGIGDVTLLTLTKAPTVTEDIEFKVGERLAMLAGEKTFLIDAHNSRFESAGKDELRGIYEGSKYVAYYEKAIREALSNKKEGKLYFGSSSFKIANIIKKDDIGKGYSSAAVFKIGNRRFAMLYFDANNMLPSLRNELIEHVRKKYNMASEVYTTDTHSVNSLAKPFTNVLGRETKANVLLPIVDIMIENALKNIEEVSYAYKSFVIKNFMVWGEDAEKEIVGISKKIIRRVKYVAPFVIAAGFVIAAWLIYLL